MSLTGQFHSDMGDEGNGAKTVGAFVIERKREHVVAWERNENDVRGWTPRYRKTFFRKDHSGPVKAARDAYGRITSIESMKDELETYADSAGYDPEIAKAE